MHALRLLHKCIGKTCPQIHAKRLAALLVGVSALLKGQCLTLTSLGRYVGGRVGAKHSIKRIDRLLGNDFLTDERQQIYQCLAFLMMGQRRQIVILVDWSDVDAARTQHILRASCIVNGRAFTLYEEVHKKEADPKIHKALLLCLKAVLPPHCCPIIVTDAGFRRPWFITVEQMGWFYVGRVRNRDFVRKPQEQQWFPCKDLYQCANQIPRHIGVLWMTEKHPYQTNFYVVKCKSQKRKCYTKTGRVAANSRSKKIAQREREPWLLVSNLPQQYNQAKRIVSIYATRMQIEESFRDLKNVRHGFKFEFQRCKTTQRVAILLLIATLATFVCWLMGLALESRGEHRLMQCNTTKHKRVLSIFFIGCEAIRLGYKSTYKECISMCEKLRQLINDQHQKLGLI